MDFYTDGSKITKPRAAIGWSAVCNKGVVIANGASDGSNINAEIFAIRDLLESLVKYKYRLIENEDSVNIITDSLTSIQIISGFMKAPHEFNISESANYSSASKICLSIKILKERGKTVKFTHIKGHEDNLGNNFADYVATQQSWTIANSTSKGEKEA